MAGLIPAVLYLTRPSSVLPVCVPPRTPRPGREGDGNDARH
jgi:hypothetical protein